MALVGKPASPSYSKLLRKSWRDGRRGDLVPWRWGERDEGHGAPMSTLVLSTECPPRPHEHIVTIWYSAPKLSRDQLPPPRPPARG